jgi:hypothetical protein
MLPCRQPEGEDCWFSEQELRRLPNFARLVAEFEAREQEPAAAAPHPSNASEDEEAFVDVDDSLLPDAEAAQQQQQPGQGRRLPFTQLPSEPQQPQTQGPTQAGGITLAAALGEAPPQQPHAAAAEQSAPAPAAQAAQQAPPAAAEPAQPAAGPAEQQERARLEYERAVQQTHAAPAARWGGAIVNGLPRYLWENTAAWAGLAPRTSPAAPQSSPAAQLVPISVERPQPPSREPRPPSSMAGAAGASSSSAAPEAEPSDVDIAAAAWAQQQRPAAPSPTNLGQSGNARFAAAQPEQQPLQQAPPSFPAALQQQPQPRVMPASFNRPNGPVLQPVGGAVGPRAVPQAGRGIATALFPDPAAQLPAAVQPASSHPPPVAGAAAPLAQPAHAASPPSAVRAAAAQQQSPGGSWYEALANQVAAAQQQADAPQQQQQAPQPPPPLPQQQVDAGLHSRLVDLLPSTVRHSLGSGAQIHVHVTLQPAAPAQAPAAQVSAAQAPAAHASAAQAPAAVPTGQTAGVCPAMPGPCRAPAVAAAGVKRCACMQGLVPDSAACTYCGVTATDILCFAEICAGASAPVAAEGGSSDAQQQDAAHEPLFQALAQHAAQIRMQQSPAPPPGQHACPAVPPGPLLHHYQAEWGGDTWRACLARMRASFG